MTMWLVIALLIALALIVAHVTLIAPNALRLTRIDAPIRDLAPALDGYSIAILSDLHYGGTTRPAQLLARAVQMANDAAPDLIVLLGDYALSHSYFPRMSRWLYEWALPPMSDQLRKLNAPDGVIAIRNREGR
jgi:predicted MPP superfamily phosphohydrolase